MSELRQIVSKDDVRGIVISDAPDSTGHIVVRFEHGHMARVPVDTLRRDANGTYRLTKNVAELEAATTTTDAQGRMVVPVIEETVEVERRRVHTGTVRVHKRVHEHEELVEEALFRENVHVEHIPIERMVETMPSPRREGDTLIIPLVEEVLVVEKRLMLKEEVHITWQRTEERRSEPVRLHSEEIVVERIPATEHPDERRHEREA